jgi:hypothetical protein
MTENKMGNACSTGEVMSGSYKNFSGKSTASVLIMAVKISLLQAMEAHRVARG